MSKAPSPTLIALREIRDELRMTREELSKRIDRTNDRLEAVETTMLDLAEQQRFVVAHLRADSVRDRRFDAELAEIRARLGALEARS